MSVIRRGSNVGRSLAVSLLSLALFACGDSGDEGVVPGTGGLGTGTNPGVAPGGALAGGQPPVQTPQTPVAGNPGVTPAPVAKPDAGVAPAPAAAPGAWCQVKAVFDKNCTTCHDGKGSFGSPFGLTSLADLKKESTQFPGKKIYERVGVRMHDKMRPMPPQGDVAPADLAAVDAWIAAGAPGSDSEMCASAPKPVEVTDWPADCEEKHKLLANDGRGGKFSARAGQYYQDFMFTPPWKGEAQAVAFRAVVDNKKVLHHYIVYDAAGSFLVGWSPGKNDHVMPPDVGVFLPASGQMKMTVHYYNVGTGAKAELDASGVEVCVAKTKKRPKTAAVMPFAANPVVPGNAPSVEIKSTCTVVSSAPATIITSSPHMHGLGIHAKLTVQRAGGATEVVHDRSFNFEEQTTYPINFQVNNGDRVTTTCIYKNPTARSVSFGTNTEDEMCFNFALYYPMCGMTCTQEDPLAAVWSLSQGGGCPTGGGGGGSGASLGGLGGLGGIFGN